MSVSLFPSVRPSVGPHETTRLPLAGYSWDFLLGVLLKSVDKICLIKIGQNARHFTRRCRHLYDNTYPDSNRDSKRFKQMGKKITIQDYLQIHLFPNIVLLLINYEQDDRAKYTINPYMRYHVVSE